MITDSALTSISYATPLRVFGVDAFNSPRNYDPSLRRKREQIIIQGMWARVAAVRLWEYWKDLVYQTKVVGRTRRKFRRALLFRLQVHYLINEQ